MSLSSSSLSLKTLEEHLVFVEGGTFQMGGVGKFDGQPMHLVQLDSFFLSRHLVSQALWEVVMGNNPSAFPHAQRPVEQVSWYDAVEFCNCLSELVGLDPYYTIHKDQKDPNNQNSFDNVKWSVRINEGSNGFRLPTEAEWEYAARGGRYHREVEYAGSSNRKEVAWFEDNSQTMSQPMGMKRPNSLGLFDMSGNLREWCQDCFVADYYQTCLDKGTVSNPISPEEGSRRVVRGGAWDNNDDDLHHVTYRNNIRSSFRDFAIGFRLSQY